MSARLAAAEVLVAVLDHGRALEDALEQTGNFAALKGRDRAFARALAGATLRRLGAIDKVLGRFLQRPLPETAFHGRALLRLGAAQLLVLGTPAHAAVGETVETANSLRQARGFSKLINAVLRRLSREGAEIFAGLPAGANLPAWLFTRWRAAYGDRAEEIAKALAHEPPLDLSLKQDAEAWAEKLGAVRLPTGGLRLAETPGAIDQLPGYGDGAWWVQDAAASLPARLLGDVRGLRVLDLCAAPGGKTLQLAAAGALVTALDKAPERLTRLRENLARTKLHAEIICADALKYRPDTLFDAILLDAPCSSTGTLRRHPDIAWLRRPNDIRALAALQLQLLNAAAAMIKPEGALVYAVCSLEPEEGEGVAAQTRLWRRSPARPGEIPGADEFITKDGDLRTLPSHWREQGGLDGFYACRLRRD